MAYKYEQLQRAVRLPVWIPVNSCYLSYRQREINEWVEHQRFIATFGALHTTSHLSYERICKCIQFNKIKQGHHHNSDQATRRLHILCSICIHLFVAWRRLYDCSSSVHSHPICVIIFSIAIFVELQSIGWLKFQMGTFEAWSLGVLRDMGSGQ